jgi:hypothetical protein
MTKEKKTFFLYVGKATACFNHDDDDHHHYQRENEKKKKDRMCTIVYLF